jgi:hypothetical protein
VVDGGTEVLEVGALVVLTGGRVVVVVSGGTVLKTMSGFTTVVAGLGAAVVATVGAGLVVAGGAVVAGAGKVVVLRPKRSAAVTELPAPLRSPTSTVDGVGRARVVVGWGREAMTRRAAGDWSRAVAAITMATKSAPTPSARKVFWRSILLLPSHHFRNRTEAGGRPNAAFLPMDGTKG